MLVAKFSDAERERLGNGDDGWELTGGDDNNRTGRNTEMDDDARLTEPQPPECKFEEDPAAWKEFWRQFTYVEGQQGKERRVWQIWPMRENRKRKRKEEVSQEVRHTSHTLLTK